MSRREFSKLKVGMYVISNKGYPGTVTKGKAYLVTKIENYSAIWVTCDDGHDRRGPCDIFNVKPDIKINNLPKTI